MMTRWPYWTTTCRLRSTVRASRALSARRRGHARRVLLNALIRERCDKRTQSRRALTSTVQHKSRDGTFRTRVPRRQLRRAFHDNRDKAIRLQIAGTILVFGPPTAMVSFGTSGGITYEWIVVVQLCRTCTETQRRKTAHFQWPVADRDATNSPVKRRRGLRSCTPENKT